MAKHVKELGPELQAPTENWHGGKIIVGNQITRFSSSMIESTRPATSGGMFRLISFELTQ